jgi:DNA-binding LytR/AlgR family response regulator
MKVAIVDDEPLARARLARQLAKIRDVELAFEAESGHAALSLIAQTNVDAMLLDIQMPGIDGLSVASTPGMPAVIFTTAHMEFAARAFDLDAVDYLTKPIRQERLERALERVRRRVGSPADPSRCIIAVHGASGVRMVDVTRARALRATDKYTEATVDGETHLLRESLDSLEVRLADHGFVRAHRNVLLKADAITELTVRDGALSATLDDGTDAEISRRQAPTIRRLLRIRK